MQKRTIAPFIVAFALALSACGGGGTDDDYAARLRGQTAQSGQTSQTAPTPQPAPTAQPMQLAPIGAPIPTAAPPPTMAPPPTPAPVVIQQAPPTPVPVVITNLVGATQVAPNEYIIVGPEPCYTNDGGYSDPAGGQPCGGTQP
jgi:hypothetical protein